MDFVCWFWPVVAERVDLIGLRLVRDVIELLVGENMSEHCVSEVCVFESSVKNLATGELDFAFPSISFLDWLIRSRFFLFRSKIEFE